MTAREGMVFAAGWGRRLGALGIATPKPLLDLGGRPLVEHAVRALEKAGVVRIVVNVHRAVARFEAWRRARPEGGAEILFSVEADGPLETGGGLAAALPLLAPTGPVLLANADVVGDLDLAAVVARHEAEGPEATLVVASRPSARGLWFDERGLLGRVDDARGVDLRVRPAEGPVRRLAFQGLHVASAAGLEALGRFSEPSTSWSILDGWLARAAAGAAIAPYDAGDARWLDVGTPEDYERARASFAGEGDASS